MLNEELAEQYLLEHNILKTFTNCEKCNSKRISKISRGRYRCVQCESEWGDRKGSILHRQSLTASQLLGIIKLFQLELTATQTATELNMNERTTQRIYEKIREAIIGTPNTSLTSIIKDHTQNFAISIIDGIVNISLDDNTDKANLFKLKRTRVPSKETTYNFNYTNVKPSEIEKCLNQLPLEQNYFWRYTRLRLNNFRSTSNEYLYSYLKEIEFRYNNRSENLFNRIVEKLACFEIN